MKAFRNSAEGQFSGLASSFSWRRSGPDLGARRAQPCWCPDLGLRTSLPPSQPLARTSGSGSL